MVLSVPGLRRLSLVAVLISTILICSMAVLQKKHWKAEHKAECSKTKRIGGKHK